MQLLPFKQVVATREDPNCGELVECTLVNLRLSGGPRNVFDPLPEGVTPVGEEVTVYKPADAGDSGWSMQCQTEGVIDYVKYYIDSGEVKTHYSSPFWKNGDNNGTYVNKFEYLETCGMKTVDVELHTWVGGDDFPCDYQTIHLEAMCEKGIPPYPTPVLLPVSPPPTPVPTPSPTTEQPVYVACEPGKELIDGVCVSEIPNVTYCKRGGWFLHYNPSVPKGWKIEAERDGKDDRRFIKITNSDAVRVYIGGRKKRIQAGSVERWFHSFRYQAYNLRFIDANGRAGPWTRCTYNTPIGLDLDRTGAIEHITGDFQVDLTGDGHVLHLNEWFSPTDGILIDVTFPIVDGNVTGLHMFGNSDGYDDGFAKLHELDTNNDGYVTGDELSKLAVWVDANSNAKLDKGELNTMQMHGIVSLSTMFRDGYSSFGTMDDGSSIFMEDVWFTTEH